VTLRSAWFALAIMVGCLAVPAWAQQADETEKKTLQFVPIPAVFYTPETSLGFGVSAVLLYRLPGEGLATRPSSLNGVAIYTVKKQYNISIAPEFWLGGEDYYLKLGGGYRGFPSQFYGVGKSTDLDDQESYTKNEVEGKLAFLRRAVGPLYAGVNYLFSEFEIQDVGRGGLLERRTLTGSEGGTVSSPGVAVTYDTRDNTFSARSGAHLQATAALTDPAFGADFTYAKYVIDLRDYVPLWERHALAFQATTTIIGGEAPFTQLAELGGSDNLRGIYRGRHRGRSALTLQSEYRFPIYWRFAGAVFAGAGGVEERFNFLHAADFHGAAGAGLRFRLLKNEAMNLRFDFGVSEDDLGFYVVFGEAF
jgi:outer membrane protein assembly factor BamA